MQPLLRALERYRRWGKRIIRHMVEVLQLALELGLDISLEHPVGATSWRGIPELEWLWKNLHEAVTYGCA